MPRRRRLLAGTLVAGGIVMALALALGPGLIGRIGPGPSSIQIAVASDGPSAAAGPRMPDSTPARSMPSGPDIGLIPGASADAVIVAAPGGQGAPASNGLVPGSVNATSINLSAEYVASVRLSFATRSFQVSSTMAVTNTSGKAIDRLELNTIAARLGHMTLTSTRVDGVAVSASVTGQTIHLPLGGILEPGATTSVEIAYRATLRSDIAGSNWLFTRANGILEAHRWLPWISVPTPFDRPNHGDPFVTPVSPRVRITIISDRAIRWATTGDRVGGTGLTAIYEAHDVRDFAIVGAPDFGHASATVNGVVIRVWSRPRFPSSTVLAAARIAIAREAALLGPYPYPTYDLAQTAGGYGMESPGLTWIPTGAGNLPYLVAHETGHQWFYGIVGNDQARQPYADEAATDFVARHILGLRRPSRCSTARLDLSIYAYSSACYYEDIYIQGGNFLDDTRARMGSTAFWAGIRDYLARYRFRIGGTKALLDTLDAHTPLDLVPRYVPRFPSLY